MAAFSLFSDQQQFNPLSVDPPPEGQWKSCLLILGFQILFFFCSFFACITTLMTHPSCGENSSSHTKYFIHAESRMLASKVHLSRSATSSPVPRHCGEARFLK
jgi:hypothetical protein